VRTAARRAKKVGDIISVKIAKSSRHGEVIAQSELSRRFLTFTTAGDLRFIYASRTPLCNNNTRERKRRRSHGAKEVAAPLTRTNDSHFKRHLTLFSAPENNGNLHIKFDSRRWVPVDRWWLVSRWMRGRVSLHGCIKVALSCTVTTCLKSLVSRGTETIYYLQFFLTSSFYTHSLKFFLWFSFNRKKYMLVSELSKM